MTKAVVPKLFADEELSSSPIPKIIHFVWVGSPVPEWVQNYWDRWAELHIGWKIMTWTEENSDQWPLSSLLRDQTINPVALADVIRIEMVWRHGGVYIDSDMQPLKSLDPLIQNSPWVETINSRARGIEVNNGAFGFPPRHPALVEIWSQMLASLGKKDLQNVAGPKVWRRVIPNFEVNLLDPVAFSGFKWERRHDVLKYNVDELREMFPHNYAVHEYDHSWAPSAKTVHPRSES